MKDRTTLRAWWVLALATAATGFVPGCLSPTLPLPPPGEPDVAQLSADRSSVRLEGKNAIPGALVTFFNEDPAVSAGSVATVNADGRYVVASLPVNLTKRPTNRVQFWQRRGSEESSQATIEVPYGVAFGGLDETGQSPSDAGSPSSDAANDR